MNRDIDIRFLGRDLIPTNRRLIGDIHEFIEVVEWIKSVFSDNEPWFRGVSHATYTLVPSLYRDKKLRQKDHIEEELMSDFAREALPYLDRHSSWSRWDWYWTMQHYGLPTRLLDWTESSIVALYFAIRDIDCLSTPTVWVLDPWWLNGISRPDYEMVYMPHTLLDEPEDKWVADAYFGGIKGVRYIFRWRFIISGKSRRRCTVHTLPFL